MALAVRWTPDAISSYRSIISYIEDTWSEKEVRNFVALTDAFIDRISKQPTIYKALSSVSIREGVLSKQTTVTYRVSEDHIQLLFFWDFLLGRTARSCQEAILKFSAQLTSRLRRAAHPTAEVRNRGT